MINLSAIKQLFADRSIIHLYCISFRIVIVIAHGTGKIEIAARNLDQGVGSEGIGIVRNTEKTTGRGAEIVIVIDAGIETGGEVEAGINE